MTGQGEDLRALAALSHMLERLATALAIQGADQAMAADELVDLAAGHREAAAIALSYALRTAEREPGDIPETAALLLRLALSPPHWHKSR